MRRFRFFGILLATLFITHPLWAGDRSVRYVLDGDTVILDNGEKVRLIGIDAPEIHDQARNRRNAEHFGISPERVDEYAYRARSYLIKAIEHETVRLEYGDEMVDRYGRTLAYLYRARDGLFINKVMVQEGYALVYYRFIFKYRDDFIRDEETARQHHKGIWAK